MPELLMGENQEVVGVTGNRLMVDTELAITGITIEVGSEFNILDYPEDFNTAYTYSGNFVVTGTTVYPDRTAGSVFVEVYSYDASDNVTNVSGTYL